MCTLDRLKHTGSRILARISYARVMFERVSFATITFARVSFAIQQLS